MPINERFSDIIYHRPESINTNIASRISLSEVMLVRRGKLARDAAFMSAFSVIMSAVGMSFSVWLAGRMGSSGIGLFQLISSVTALGVTFAVSGIRFAATRLVSEELGGGEDGLVRSAMGKCIGYALFFGFAACALMWLLADIIGVLWIGDARTVQSIRISAFSMPCIAVSSALSGYFTACGRVWKPTVLQFAEQIISIAFAALFLSRSDAADLSASCAAVASGRLIGDALAAFASVTVYAFDLKRHFPESSCGSILTGRMLGIALPLAFSAYARSALSTVLHLFVPKGLRTAGLSPDAALSSYGVIQGMALPVLLFPSCVMAAFAELIVPELTAQQISGSGEEIRRRISSLVGKALRVSMLLALGFMLLSDALGNALYHSAEAGRYIRLFAALVPVMYTDMMIDGCLKGLGQQLWCMLINIADVLSGLIIVLIFVPRYGLDAYIVMIFLTETLNTVLSALRLRLVVKRA